MRDVHSGWFGDVQAQALFPTNSAASELEALLQDSQINGSHA